MNDELYHFGVKGMKWGIRKDPKKEAERKRKRTLKKKQRQKFREMRSTRNELTTAYDSKHRKTKDRLARNAKYEEQREKEIERLHKSIFGDKNLYTQDRTRRVEYEDYKRKRDKHVTDEMVKKYGPQSVKDLEDRDAMIDGTIFAASLGAVLLYGAYERRKNK